MRKLCDFIFCLNLLFVLLNLSSCKEDDANSKELGDYIKIQNIDDFKKIVSAGAQIVDYRCRDSFAAGHIPGAINIEASAFNTQDSNSGFCKAIKDRFSKDKFIFLYGDKSKSLEGMYLPGIVSDLGWGKYKTYHFLPGYEGWVEEDGEIVTEED